MLAFDDDLRSLKQVMMSSIKPSNSQSQDTQRSIIPDHLQGLEEHAQEMASLLESLTSHFDLCVNAIRHTEGGFAAVRKAASNPPPGSEPVSVSGVITSSGEQAQDIEPISDKDRKDMLKVLETDAAQVGDVVMELQDHLSDMEIKHQVVLDRLSDLTATYDETQTAFSILENIGTRLSGYIVASQDFRLRWEETKGQIQEQMEELESMRVFYENYHSCYDSLILEVARRKQVEEKIKSVMKKAMKQIDEITAVDAKEREGFKVDVGDFLPVDLYPGVNAKMRTWDSAVCEKASVGEEDTTEELPETIPNLEREVVEAAGKKERDRARTEMR